MFINHISCGRRNPLIHTVAHTAIVAPHVPNTRFSSGLAFLWILFYATGAIALGASSVRASPILPQAVYSAGFQDEQLSFNSIGNYAGTYQGVRYNFILNPQYVRSFSSVSSAGSGNAGSHPYAVAQYYFEIVGPTANDIPLSITYSIFVLASAYYDPNAHTGSLAQAQIAYPVATSSQNPSGVAIKSLQVFATGGTQNNNSTIETVETTLSANHVYSVSLSSQGYVENTDFFGNCCYFGKTEAVVDPYLRIPSNFANADQYTLAFSPGVQNGSPFSVPEPSSLLLLGGGLAGLGVVRLRSYKKKDVPGN